MKSRAHNVHIVLRYVNIAGVLTISLAGVVYFGEVFMAAAFIGALSVVADVRTHSEMITLIFICQQAKNT